MRPKRARAKSATQMLWSLGLAGVLSVGITADIRADAEAATAPDVLFFGCKVTRATQGQPPVCMPDADWGLLLWVRDRSCDALQVVQEGSSLPVTSKTVHNGCQLKTTLQPYSVATSLVVSNRYTGESSWTMQIQPAAPNLMDWTQRVQLRAVADLSDLTAELRRKKSTESRVDKRVDYAMASAWAYRRLGQLDLARQEYREAIELAKSSGYSSVAVEALYRLAHTLRISGFIPEARETLEEAKAWMTWGHGKEHNDWAYHNANILQDEGRLSEAAEWFTRVLEDAEKIDHRERVRIATMCLAELFVRLDMIASAQKLLSTFDVLLSDVTGCEERVNLLALKGWMDVQVARNENLNGAPVGITQPRAKQTLFDALKIEAQCKNNHNRANILTNLAEAAMLENNLNEAQSWIDRASKVPGIPVFDELDLLRLAGRLELQGGRPKDALRSFERLNKLTQENPDVGYRLYQCSAALGMVESLRALGQPTGAYSEMVKSCLDNKAKTLGPWDHRNLRSRAKDAGVIN